MLVACAGRPYVHESPDSADIRARADSQTERLIRVSASVPGREETEAIFGIDLYDQGIQPVWLEIQNNSESAARYAPVSTDRFYFSPHEVAYKNRGGYSDEARVEMEKYFDSVTMPRFIHAGQTRSGYVFTHVDWGAKGFNVDVFNSGSAHHFSFLIRVPGFVPDYANIDFDKIYSEEDVASYNGDQIYEALKRLPCCSAHADGELDDDALNIVFIGAGKDLLVGLLRSNWLETAAGEAANDEVDYLFDRPQDAIFRYESAVDSSIYELRLWLAPMLVDGEQVWIAQVRHYYKVGGFTVADPDIDNARDFTLQNVIYGQSLSKLGWLSGSEVVPVDTFWQSLVRPPYFTDGHRIVLWLEAEPVSMREIEAEDWDSPPGYSR